MSFEYPIYRNTYLHIDSGTKKRPRIFSVFFGSHIGLSVKLRSIKFQGHYTASLSASLSLSIARSVRFPGFALIRTLRFWCLRRFAAGLCVLNKVHSNSKLCMESCSRHAFIVRFTRSVVGGHPYESEGRWILAIAYGKMY